MGYKLTSFNFIPGENEQIEAVIKVPKEPRSVIHGIVKDYHNRVVKDAVVKLFKTEHHHHPKGEHHHHNCDLEPITHTFTDECGQFLFGPLDPNIKYVIKVWINHVKIRELVIKPDDGCDPEPPCKVENYIDERELD